MAGRGSNGALLALPAIEQPKKHNHLPPQRNGSYSESEKKTQDCSRDTSQGMYRLSRKCVIRVRAKLHLMHTLTLQRHTVTSTSKKTAKIIKSGNTIIISFLSDRHTVRGIISALFLVKDKKLQFSNKIYPFLCPNF